MARESEIYEPVKAFLEGKGYEVKAEINGCDVVACKVDEPALVVELKLTFSLDLILQGIDRQAVSDCVYLAVLAPDTPAKRKNWRSRRRDYLKLCRMLGLGLITVDLSRKPGQQTEALLDPAPYAPRKNKRKQSRLINEFTARVGDPNTGGINRTKIITAYRQDALRCAMVLARHECMKLVDIRSASGVAKAASIFQKNHYGWFERTARGVYALTPEGVDALQTYAEALPSLTGSE